MAHNHWRYIVTPSVLAPLLNATPQLESAPERERSRDWKVSSFDQPFPAHNSIGQIPDKFYRKLWGYSLRRDPAEVSWNPSKVSTVLFQFEPSVADSSSFATFSPGWGILSAESELWNSNTPKFLGPPVKNNVVPLVSRTRTFRGENSWYSFLASFLSHFPRILLVRAGIEKSREEPQGQRWRSCWSLDVRKPGISNSTWATAVRRCSKIEASWINIEWSGGDLFWIRGELCEII